jgi:hypothetical protein
MFILLHMNIQCSQHHLLKTLSFFQCMFSKIVLILKHLCNLFCLYLFLRDRVLLCDPRLTLNLQSSLPLLSAGIIRSAPLHAQFFFFFFHILYDLLFFVIFFFFFH